MKGHGSKLPRKREQAIAALLSSPSFQAAADKVGVGVSTLWRWSQQEDFKASYRDARRRVVQHALIQCQTAMQEGVQALRDLLADPATPAASKVSAAKVLLDFGLKATEVEELEIRVESLEKGIPVNSRVA